MLILLTFTIACKCIIYGYMETYSVTVLNQGTAFMHPHPRAVCIPRDSISSILDSSRCHILHTFSFSQMSLIFCSVLGVVTTWQHVEFSFLSGLMLLVFVCLFVWGMLPKAHSKVCQGGWCFFSALFLDPQTYHCKYDLYLIEILNKHYFYDFLPNAFDVLYFLRP